MNATYTNITHPLDILADTQAESALNNSEVDFAKRKAESIKNDLQTTTSQTGLDIPPIHILPEPLQKLAYQLNERDRFPLPFILTAMIYGFSVAMGNNYRARKKSTWSEAANIYICIIAPPSSMKSPVIGHFLDVFEKRDEENFKIYEASINKHEADIKASTKDNPYKGEEPVFKQLLFEDFTSEALNKAFKINKRGIGIAVDELAGLFAQMDRYNGGGDMQTFLSLHNQKNKKVNRSGARANLVSKPFASIIGGLQPGVAKSVFTDEMWHNGLAPRFLYCCPDGLKKEVAGDDELDPGVQKVYTKAIDFLLDFKEDEPIVFDFDKEAKAALKKYLLDKADVYNGSNDDRLKGVVGKVDYHVIRLSLIIQVMHDVVATGSRYREITKESVIAAGQLTDYFLSQAERVMELVDTRKQSPNQDLHVKFIKALPEGEFKLSDAVKIAMEIRPTPDEKDAKAWLETIRKWTKRFLDDPKNNIKWMEHNRYIKSVANA